MAIHTIYDLCTPRPDVLAGTASDSDFAADLSHVVRGSGGPVEYSNPARFFANTYPTRGLRSLLANVCGRLSGRGGSVAAIFRLDTSFGGGKTHGLIALVHAARLPVGSAIHIQAAGAHASQARRGCGHALVGTRAGCFELGDPERAHEARPGACGDAS